MSTLSINTKPIYLTQWAGSKRRLLPQYLPAFPVGDTFTDLFGGSGIVTANVQYANKNFNELQTEWTECLYNLTYNTDLVVAEYEQIVAAYMAAEDSKVHYEWLLRQYTGNYSAYNIFWEAAALILLVQSCFGGIWTSYLWAKGRYSTPYGKRNKKYLSSRLTDFATVMQGTTFSSLDWKDVELKGFVFADPPYRSNYGNPIDYDSTHEVNHELLADRLKAHGSFAYCATDLGDGWLDEHFPGYSRVELDIAHTAKRSGADRVKEVMVYSSVD